METLNAFFNGQFETRINSFRKFALSTEAMNKVKGGDGTIDIWIPDDNDKDKSN
jgi:hypothetical protein